MGRIKLKLNQTIIFLKKIQFIEQLVKYMGVGYLSRQLVLICVMPHLEKRNRMFVEVNFMDTMEKVTAKGVIWEEGVGTQV